MHYGEGVGEFILTRFIALICFFSNILYRLPDRYLIYGNYAIDVRDSKEILNNENLF